MKLYFSTLFDVHYLARGLVLYESLKQHHKNFVLYLVCLDAKVFEYFAGKNLPEIVLISLEEIEETYRELSEVKPVRDIVDYIFTLSPFYPSFILKKHPGIPFICTLDCDQFFFDDSSYIFRLLDKYSIIITPHRFTKGLEHLEIFGKFNVSFQIFKNNQVGNACLSLWRSKCIEWCSDIYSDGKFADQKYLDEWQLHFGNEVCVISDVGFGLAPWNIGDKKIRRHGKKIYVNESPLVLYHYHGLRILHRNIINSGFHNYGVKPSSSFVRYVLENIVIAIFKFQPENIDSISRNAHRPQKIPLKYVSSYGMFYRFKRKLISLDKLYEINLRKKKVYGLYNRLKNLYRPKGKSYSN